MLLTEIPSIDTQTRYKQMPINEWTVKRFAPCIRDVSTFLSAATIYVKITYKSLGEDIGSLF